MDNSRRGAAKVLAAMTETLSNELQFLIDAEEDAIEKGRGDADVLDNLESALDNLTAAEDALQEAAKAYEPPSPIQPPRHSRGEYSDDAL